jgi:hypothetical protein
MLRSLQVRKTKNMIKTTAGEGNNPERPDSYISPAKDPTKVFLGAIVEGRLRAKPLLPRFLAKDGITKIDEALGAVDDQLVRSVVEMYLYSRQILDISYHPGAKRTKEEKEKTIRFDRALESVLAAIEGTSIIAEQLINTLSIFAKENYGLKPQDRDDYEHQLAVTISGIWNERGAGALAKASGIYVERGTLLDDMKGGDIFVDYNGQELIKVDLKSTRTSVVRKIEEQQQTEKAEFSENDICVKWFCDPSNQLDDHGLPIGSIDSPVMFVMPVESDRFIMAVDFGLFEGMPRSLATPRFGANRPKATGSMLEAYDFMLDYVDKHPEFETYIGGQDKHISGSTVRGVGGLALAI